MKALVYHGPAHRSWETVADPKPIEPTDIVVRVDTTTICGTDLHILKGDVPAVKPGRVLGHEAVGTVVEVGSAVSTLSHDDRVLVPAITSCGRCSYCKRAMPSHCQAVGGIGWIFGHLIDGTQAEYVRVPFAETSVHKVPDGVSDEQVIDLADSRLEHARKFGADVTINSGTHDVDARIAELTDGGADVAIEAVGIPQTFETCTRIVRAGGVVANVGVHGASATLHLEDLWIKNVTITMGLVDGTTVPMLLALVREGKIRPEMFGTHDFNLQDTMGGYDVFAEAGKNNALKVVIKR